jgi:hypothetical protein
MPRQILKILLPSTHKYKQATKNSHDKARYPRLIGTVIKYLKNDLRTKALQEELSALGIVCVAINIPRSLSFQDIDNKLLLKMTKVKRLNI